MKKTLLAAAIAMGGFAAINSVSASVSPNDGDVFLGIRDVTASTAYVLDLGSFDNFYNHAGATYANPYSLNQGFTAANLLSDLNTYVGNGWYNNSNVVYGLFGGYQAGSSDSSIPNLPDNALIVGRLTLANTGNIADQTINGLTSDQAAIGSDASGKANGTVSNSWISPNGGVSAWASYQYVYSVQTGTNSDGAPTYTSTGPSGINNNFGTLAYGALPGTLETQVKNPLYVNTVYSSDNSLNNGFKGAVIGSIHLTSDGSLSVVPEPSTYVLFGIGALVLVTVARRRA